MSLAFRKYSSWLPLLGIFLVGLAVRLYALDGHSLWFDETASIEVAQRGLRALLTDRFGWMQVQTPLHYLIVWLSIQPIDPTTTAALVRLPSALAGALTLLVTYALGRELFGRLQGLLAALLLALSAVHINYSQDVRPYALLTLLTALSAYSLLKADRTHSAGWWAAFAFATAANVANSYNVLTLVLPALAPYVLWALWKMGQRVRAGQDKARIFVPAFLSLAFIGAACLLALSDLLQVPRTAPDLNQLPPVALLTSVTELAAWFTQFGLDGGLERSLELVFLLLCALGVYAGLRRSNRSGTALCLLFMLVPAPVLAILGTTNVVYQRYALFTMPFYFLLIGSGGAALVQAVGRRLSQDPRQVGRARLAAAALVVLLLAPSAYSVYARNTNYTQTNLVYRPDLRGVSAYLSAHATPRDAIIFAGWDPTVSNFYWKGAPPAPAYSVRDPRLFNMHIQGTLYWVVSFDFDLPPAMSSDPHWRQVARFERVALYREGGEPGGVVDLGASMERFVGGLERPNERTEQQQITDTLRGCVLQAHGDVSGAVQAYRRAGTSFSIGGEYLRTAKGFVAHHEPDKAWRDALIAKTVEPERPDIHLFMADMLAQMGLPAESAVEREIAGELQAAPPKARIAHALH